MSANFGHLLEISPELHRLGTLAERFFAEDANTSLIKSRQFGEYMVKEIAALSGVYDSAARETTNDLLRRLATQQVLPREVADIFHAVRKSGNDATHDLAGSPAEALAALKFCRALGVWYRRTYGRDPGFKSGPFVPPRASADIDQATQAELTALRAQVREAEEKLATAHASAEDLAKARVAAEELARQASADGAVWEQTAVEMEANQAALARKLAELQKAAEAQPEQLQIEFKQAGLKAASSLELDERQTRRLIDVQLVDAGWEADSDRLAYQKGARPEEGRNLAIAEWPSDGGRADYALFVGLTCVGVIEAKRESVDVPSTLQQAERYARTIVLTLEELHPYGPWKHGLDEPFRVPFVFATNGRPYVRQWVTKSGIWYRDVRRETNHAVPMTSWFSPKDLLDKLTTDVDTAAQGLAEESFGKGRMRPYQEEAIAAIETAVVAYFFPSRAHGGDCLFSIQGRSWSGLCSTFDVITG
ncbi:type I restriction endonuclease [Rhizobium sp. WL3]|uniref:type I restriction endonuclease n=1 Tax=Rhizobium sp. WL3 TaxID=2603277 RepID=UPI001FED558A|nr:type I restriction endonuclease [Rhizobium sp. WL3]